VGFSPRVSSGWGFNPNEINRRAFLKPDASARVTVCRVVVFKKILARKTREKNRKNVKKHVPVLIEIFLFSEHDLHIPGIFAVFR
jgi:hypothetical protein